MGVRVVSAVARWTIKTNGTQNLFIWIDVDDIVIRSRLHWVAICRRRRRRHRRRSSTRIQQQGSITFYFIIYCLTRPIGHRSTFFSFSVNRTTRIVVHFHICASLRNNIFMRLERMLAAKREQRNIVAYEYLPFTARVGPKKICLCSSVSLGDVSHSASVVSMREKEREKENPVVFCSGARKCDGTLSSSPLYSVFGCTDRPCPITLFYV